MSEKLSAGYRIKTLLGKDVIIEKWLAEGGQGDVYVVKYNGEQKALKWYKPKGMGKKPKAFYENLKSNAMRGAPSPEFLWPLDVTEWVDGVFGYIMDLRPEGYYEVGDFMLTNVRFASYKTVIDAALHIVSAYRILHNMGYSYQDLNDGNFFINPKNGKVLICDNDNVAPNGTETGIVGKPRYMAPEIVYPGLSKLNQNADGSVKPKYVQKNGKDVYNWTPIFPDNLTDRFSMSVILFILFCMTHPLEGKRSLVPSMSPEQQEKLYGSEALFIMDPDDKSNAPDPKIHRNMKVVWPCLPDYMKDIFLKAFSKKAMSNPNARPKELDWINCLVRFRSEIVQCQCGNEIFTEDGAACACDSCRKKANIPFRLVFSEYAIPGIAGSRIYRCQLGTCNANDALNPVGQVLANKNDPSLLGIKNMSDKSWNATTPSGKAKRVMPGDVIPLKAGIAFTINEETIKIESN